MDFANALDLKIGALKKAGELTDGTSDYDGDAIEQINLLYRSLFAGGNEFSVDLGEVWEWAKARAPGLLVLVAPYETGTVALTNASASGTFSDAPGAGLGSLAGRFLRVTDRNTIYRITAHTAGDAAFTLDQVYLEASGSLGFKAIKTDYAISGLSGIERLAQAMNCYSTSIGREPSAKIVGLDSTAFDMKYPKAFLRAGMPQAFSILHYDQDGTYTVRFSTYVTEDTRVEYEYIPLADRQAVIEFDGFETVEDTDTDQLHIDNHGLVTGQQVQFIDEETSELVEASATSLQPGQRTFYVIKIDQNEISLAYTYAEAFAGTAIALGSTGINFDIDGTDDTYYLATIPALPLSFRKVLFYAACHFIMVDKSDSRASYYSAVTQSTLQAMVSANRKMKRHTSPNKGRLISRMDSPGVASGFYTRLRSDV